MGKRRTGAMVISLDFELMWGVIDHHDIETYGKQVLGARLATERILELFELYGIHATWAIVGFLFCKDKEELINNTPLECPQYSRKKYSTYSYLDRIGIDDSEYYFAPELVDKIWDVKYQEIASHTFSHYYCLESGQTKEQFEADMEMFEKISGQLERPIRSIVFPRNQLNATYKSVLKKHGIHNYRGNELAWCYQESDQRGNNLLRRGFRLLDAYLNIFGYHCYDVSDMADGELCNVRSSRFFRPYNSKLAFLEPLRLRRIKKQMLHAARNAKVFHLWWHPHNFGSNLETNMENLKNILDYYQILNRKYGFMSMTMEEAGGI